MAGLNYKKLEAKISLSREDVQNSQALATSFFMKKFG